MTSFCFLAAGGAGFPALAAASAAASASTAASHVGQRPRPPRFVCLLKAIVTPTHREQRLMRFVMFGLHSMQLNQPRPCAHLPPPCTPQCMLGVPGARSTSWTHPRTAHARFHSSPFRTLMYGLWSSLSLSTT